jgi:TM2 domain-containing membrane protein YozV
MSVYRVVALAVVATFLVFWSAALAQRRGPRYALAVLLGWAVPGLGHVITGRPIKGAIFFGLLALVYGVGLVLLSGHAISYEDQEFYYIGQYGSGITWALAALLGQSRPHLPEGVPMSWFDPGTLYVGAPGLLNLVIVLSLFQPRPAQPTPKAETPP